MKLCMKDTDKEEISTESLFFLHLLPFFLLHDVVTCVFILSVIGGGENHLFISSRTSTHILSLIPLSDFSQKRDRKDGFIEALSLMRQHCFLSTRTGRMQDNERLCVYPFYQSEETMWGSHDFPPASCQGLCYSALLPWITCDKEGVLVKYYLASNTLICVGHILLHTSLKRRSLVHLPPHPLYSLGFERNLGSLIVLHRSCYQLYNLYNTLLHCWNTSSNYEESCFYIGTMRSEVLDWPQEKNTLMVIIMAMMWKILLSPDPCFVVELI